MKKIEKLLNNGGENYIFPFFWQHGEDEDTLRKYMRVIAESNCKAVCVESRPHPEFLGEKWWKDMDVILDEAKKLDMKVWILDDSHFPTGYANGAVKDKPLELRRQSIYTKVIKCEGKKKYSLDVSKVFKKLPTTMMWKIVGKTMNKGADIFDDDCILDIAAFIEGNSKPVSITYDRSGNKLTVLLPDGTKKLYITILTRNAGIHRDYINMMDEESCRILIDTVYEPHYAHYKEEFGKTIMGFFSDEPELGNGIYFTNQVKVGNDFDMPWSRPLLSKMKEAFGEDWKSYIPMLFDNEENQKEAARVRLIYMDAVTKLVEESFSKQIGKWCEDHGVSYIGHLIEDNNQHCRTGASLGHYFRGLSGQHMAGIDDIGGQVLPFKEDAPAEGLVKWMGGRDGEFYHYCLGALGASAAAIDPRKEGRCMCEIFGNYGWSEGPRLEKYLADHFMVQGINHFVPHAFSPKEYPDPDCPPHFFAGGHNPQYRAFGKVIAYMNRICNLISDGKPVCSTAVLYQAKQEWMGAAMPDQKIMRVLMENQITGHILPEDVFAETDRYASEITEGALVVNGNKYHVLLIPESEFITANLAKKITELARNGIEVYFINSMPHEVVGEDSQLLKQDIMATSKCISLTQIPDYVETDITISPANSGIRSFHYRGDEEIIYLVNETPSTYSGTVSVKGQMDLFGYDAWNNKLFAIPTVVENKITKFKVCLNPMESFIAVISEGRQLPLDAVAIENIKKIDLLNNGSKWQQSICKAIEYPNFIKEETIASIRPYSDIDKNFSGYIAYETTIHLDHEWLSEIQNGKKAYLCVESAGEDIELFMNGVSVGIQVIEPFSFDVTKFVCEGTNTLRIEVATTLERERKVNKGKQGKTGITGAVTLNLMHE